MGWGSDDTCPPYEVESGRTDARVIRSDPRTIEGRRHDAEVDVARAGSEGARLCALTRGDAPDRRRMCRASPRMARRRAVRHSVVRTCVTLSSAYRRRRGQVRSWPSVAARLGPWGAPRGATSLRRVEGAAPHPARRAAPRVRASTRQRSAATICANSLVRPTGRKSPQLRAFCNLLRAGLETAPIEPEPLLAEAQQSARARRRSTPVHGASAGSERATAPASAERG